ncbi:MAG: hypothetical protein QOG75_6063 [Mycobacterium sp.]|nr:hypothetical protein [Mycobacterium sp.]
MVGLAVELAQFGVEVGAHAARRVLAEGQHRVGEHRPPVCGDENQVGVQVINRAPAPAQVINRAPAPAYVGIGLAVRQVAEGGDRGRPLVDCS